MWEKVKSFCLHSVTIAWSYILAVVGAVLQVIDVAGDIVGDPSLKEQISIVVGDPKTLGYIMLGISIITIIARLRSLRKGP